MEYKYKKHAIQFERIIVRELSFKKKDINEPSDVVTEPKFFIGKSDYDKQNHSISIGLIAKIEGDKSKFNCTVDIIGVFSVDENNFDIKNLDSWSKVNAPFILHPYLREHLFKLTLEATGEGYLLPLVEVPTSGQKILAE
jgi:preprotein translocase subunit SecB